MSLTLMRGDYSAFSSAAGSAMIAAMTALPKTRLTVDEYLAWAQAQPGRYELDGGIVHPMSPESAGHARAKFAVQTALVAGIRARGLPCYVLPNGMTVRVDARTG